MLNRDASNNFDYYFNEQKNLFIQQAYILQIYFLFLNLFLEKLFCSTQ